MVIGTVQRQTSLFYAVFASEAHLMKDEILDEIDGVLEDEELVGLVREALGRRRPNSKLTGRYGIAPDRLLRCCVLKHIKEWSLRDLEREVRGSLVYRRFTRFDADRIPTHKTFSLSFGLLGEDLVRKINDRVVLKAREARIVRGSRLRTDTTVTETNIHYPADSTLLADGIRVLTRSLKKLADECAPGALQIVDHTRATKRGVLKIYGAAKAMATNGRERLQAGYSKLLSISSEVLRKAEDTVDALSSGKLIITGSDITAVAILAELDHFRPLVKKVIDQTNARVFAGNTHFPGKILSLFEEHSQVVRKGKAHKPTEFGRLVRIDEVENGIVSNYDVLDGNKSDQMSWEPALDQHERLFGKAPDLATADRGFSSAKNERAAKARGVKKVVLPARGRLTAARRKLQKQRWFRKGMRWRGGIEARIATLKHRFDMERAVYKQERGFKRSIGLSVVANNLVSIARMKISRKKKKIEQDRQKAA